MKLTWSPQSDALNSITKGFARRALECKIGLNTGEIFATQSIGIWRDCVKSKKMIWGSLTFRVKQDCSRQTRFCRATSWRCYGLLDQSSAFFLYVGERNQNFQSSNLIFVFIAAATLQRDYLTARMQREDRHDFMRARIIFYRIDLFYRISSLKY